MSRLESKNLTRMLRINGNSKIHGDDVMMATITIDINGGLESSALLQSIANAIARIIRELDVFCRFLIDMRTRSFYKL